MRQQIMIISTMFLMTTFSLVANNPFQDDFPQTNFSGSQYKFERQVLQKAAQRVRQKVGQSTPAQSDSYRWDQAAADALQGITSVPVYGLQTLEVSIASNTDQAGPELFERRAPLSSDDWKLDDQFAQPVVDHQSEIATQSDEQAQVQENMPRPWSHVIKKLGMPIIAGTIVVGFVLGLVHQ